MTFFQPDDEVVGKKFIRLSFLSESTLYEYNQINICMSSQGFSLWMLSSLAFVLLWLLMNII